jgi:hypothetical protein
MIAVVAMLMMAVLQASAEETYGTLEGDCAFIPECEKTFGTSWYYCRGGPARSGCKQAERGMWAASDCTVQCKFSNPAVPLPCPASLKTYCPVKGKFYYCQNGKSGPTSSGGADGGCKALTVGAFPIIECDQQCIYDAHPENVYACEFPTSCPSDVQGVNYYYCMVSQSNNRNGCKQAVPNHGAWPAANCDQQCLAINPVIPECTEDDGPAACGAMRPAYKCLSGEKEGQCFNQAWLPFLCTSQCLAHY